MRLFVALELPAPVRAALGAAVAAPPAGLRPVAPASLHLTLCFLGEQPDPEPIRAALDRGLIDGRPRTSTAPTGIRWLPPRRPRVLAVELSDPDGELARLSARVHAALGRRPEHPRFLPHVTVARVRGRLASLPPIDTPAVRPFAPGPVALVRSHLGAGPARYERLALWPIR